MKEELIKLREELHNSQRYVVIDEKGRAYSDELTMEEVKKIENTDEIINGMEKAMKNGIIAYYQSGKPLDTVGVAMFVKMISTKAFAKKLKEAKSNDERKKYLKEYWSYPRKYIYVTGDLCSANCFESEGSVSDLEPECYKTEEFSGIVDLDKFISKLKELGYNNLTLCGFEDIEILNCEQFSELVSSGSDFDPMLNLIVPLVKEEKDNSFGTK